MSTINLHQAYGEILGGYGSLIELYKGGVFRTSWETAEVLAALDLISRALATLQALGDGVPDRGGVPLQ
jgi:hypothetical protein